MEYPTAEQAVEAAKGLTFEKVWSALMETRKNMDESFQKMDESSRKTDESIRKTEKIVADLSNNLGHLGNSLGYLTEALFSAQLCNKFNDYGYPFTKQSSRVKFTMDGKTLTEVDLLLEDGDYIMPVEVKTHMEQLYVNYHLQRMEKIRLYMDKRSDTRKLVGAIAGGVIEDNVIKYAHENGLYVVVQTGDSIAIADMPENFKPREW